MRSYKNARVFAIRSHNTDKIYIDSTIIKLLSRKLHAFREHYKKYLDGKVAYHPSFEVLEKGNFYIELIENVSCKDKNELKKREHDIIRATPNCINFTAKENK